MKKILTLITILILSSCAYEPVSDGTTMSLLIVKKANTILKDSSNGYYPIYSSDHHYWFKKDSTSIHLVQKYFTDSSFVAIDWETFVLLLILSIILLVVVLYHIFNL